MLILQLLTGLYVLENRNTIFMLSNSVLKCRNTLFTTVDNARNWMEIVRYYNDGEVASCHDHCCKIADLVSFQICFNTNPTHQQNVSSNPLTQGVPRWWGKGKESIIFIYTFCKELWFYKKIRSSFIFIYFSKNIINCNRIVFIWFFQIFILSLLDRFTYLMWFCWTLECHIILEMNYRYFIIGSMRFALHSTCPNIYELSSQLWNENLHKT